MYENLIKTFATVLLVIGISSVIFTIAWLREETTVDRPTQFMLVVLLLTMIGAAFVLLVPTAAWSHSWYPTECCNDGHCRSVPCSEVTAGPDGKARWGAFSRFNHERASPDQQCHVCVDAVNGFGFCIYLPKPSS